jgi:hypothetical protein
MYLLLSQTILSNLLEGEGLSKIMKHPQDTSQPSGVSIGSITGSSTG